MIQQLFTEIEGCNRRTQGWATIEKQYALGAAIATLRPNISMELGIWGGKSFLPMALAHRSVGNGVAIGIDPWLPSHSVAGQVKEHSDWWGKADHESVFNEFTSLWTGFGLKDWSQVHRMTSDRYNPTEPIGVLSIDGNHGDQVLKDVERYAPKVYVGGLIFMDDLTWPLGNVTKATSLLESMGFKELYRVQNKDRGGLDDWGVWQRIK